MIEDRKFWYAPGDRESPWRVTGKNEVLSMDKTAPFVGAQTPVLTVTPADTVSLVQNALGLKANLDYTGRIILKATPGITTVEIKLTGGNTNETVSLSDLSGDFKTYPISFRSREPVTR